MAASLYKQMKSRIAFLPGGSVLAISDFTDMAKPKTVSKMMTRLSKEGLVAKVLRSVFWKPAEDQNEPEPNEVAKALARENGWELAPTKETALHLFGMVDARPKVWTYVTNGTYRNYRYGVNSISFAHTGRRFWAKWSEKTVLFIECVRAYGKEHIDEEIKAKFRRALRGWDLKKLVEETRGAAAWIRDFTRLLCGKPSPVTEKNNKQRI